MTKVCHRHGPAFFAKSVHCTDDRTTRAAPPENKHVGFTWIINLKGRDDVLGTTHLFSAGLHHVLMVVTVVRHVPGDILLLKTSDTVFKAGCSRDGPGSRECFRIPSVGIEPIIPVRGLRGVGHLNGLYGVQVGQPPGYRQR